MKKLNPRQKAFCEFYVASGNATESAIKAGYSENYSSRRIHKMLENVGVKKYIEELSKKAQSKRIMSAIERKEWLTRLIYTPNQMIKDKLKAIDILNKMDGEYTEKVEVSGKVNNPFSNLTTEELKKLIDNG